MIKIIDDEFTLFDEFKSFCKLNSFGTRIYSHFLCYGYSFDFVDFWVQLNENNSITAAFCRLDGDFVVSLCGESDKEEVSAFLSFQDKLSITFDEVYAEWLDLEIENHSSGDVLVYKGNDSNTPLYDIVTPEIKEYHNLLLTCKSEDFFVPEYMTFLSDVSRRQQRSLCDIYGVRVDETLASCAMTVSYTDFSTIIGAVATHPNHRKHGYGGCIVKALAEKSKQRGTVYIYTTIVKNTEFYKTLGFEVTGRWIKYTLGD